MSTKGWRMWRWTRKRIALAVLSLPLLAFAAVLGDIIEDDNFRVVQPDLFRSGQLRADEWEESFAENPYRSVLNLRGANPGKPWYDLERQFAERHGLRHYDLELSAEHKPSMATMAQLIAIMRDAPKPLLIHCKEGADRSGLAAALYLAAVDKRSPALAKAQLSLWYGHFPWLTSRTVAMDEALTEFLASDETPPT